MVAGMSTARISIHMNVERPIELIDLTLSFQAVARRYRRFLIQQAKQRGVKTSDADVKLYVTKIESNCIFAELGGAVEILGALFSVMDYNNIFVEFVKNIRDAFQYYINIGREGEIEPSDVAEPRRDIEAIAEIAKVTASAASSTLEFAAIEYSQVEKDGGRETLFKFQVSSDEAADARRGALLAARALDKKTDADYNNVLMYFYQTSTDEPRSDGPTADRAIIKTISPAPLRVYFASDLDKERVFSLKSDPLQNPFKASYRVDVNVESDRNDKPTFYRVVRLHDIIPDEPES